MVTLKWGLANSDNWISAYLMGKLNPYNLVRLIHSFGVRNKAIDPVVSLCLGPCEISVGEMVSAYTAFANKGIRVAPLFVTRIEDSDGNVLSTFAPQMEEVISVSSAYKMLVMLRSVINEGTGGRVRRYGITADMGGKTGTTNNETDKWFCGFTPYYTASIWLGYDDHSKVLSKSISHTKIWQTIMSQIHEGLSTGEFTQPSGIVTAQVCSQSGKLAVAGLCDEDPRGSRRGDPGADDLRTGKAAVPLRFGDLPLAP